MLKTKPIATACLLLTSVQAALKAAPNPAAPSAIFNAQGARKQIAQMKADVAQTQALLAQSAQDAKRAQARARLKAQVRERRRQIIKIESGSKDV